MRKLLEVREFDMISSNPEFDGNGYHCIDERYFGELMQFVRSFSPDHGMSDAADYMRIGFKRSVGDTISVNNYVGLIQTPSGFQLQILPKIDFREQEEDITKKVFLRMLRSMKDFPGRVFSDATLSSDRMNLYEIFINMFVRETQQLVKHGLRSDYVPKEENLNFYKGKLLCKEHVKRNVTHMERFYVRYDEYTTNRPENRLIKSTLLKLQKESNDQENIRNIRMMLPAFELIEESRDYDRDFSKVRIDRNTTDYRNIIDWAKIFLKNKSFTTFAGTSQGKALLFPMEKVFEEYIARELKKVIDPSVTLRTQSGGRYLFDDPRKFMLRPDILMTTGNGKMIILDTKWKRLENNPAVNYGMSQQDMYQMFAYAERFETPYVWLVYPKTKELSGYDNEIHFRSKNRNEDLAADIHVFFADLVDIEDSMKELVSLIYTEVYGYYD